MNTFVRLLYISLASFILSSCHHIDEWEDSAHGNFDALWTILDEHYCFFDEKEIDWDEIGEKYRARIVPGITDQELFALCAEMIDE